MKERITMPQLGETVSEGTVTKWLRQQGDAITADEPLVEIQTDKVSMEVPSLRSGVLLEILVAEGQTVPVGAALAWMEADGSDIAATPLPDGATMLSEAPPAPDPVADAEPGQSTRPTPLIRRLLAEAGLSASDITGTGPGGRIRREDVAAAAARVEAAAAPRPTAPQPPPRAGEPASAGRSEPLSPVRRVIAERMVASLRTSAQLTSVVEVDVSRIAELRRRSAFAPALAGAKLSFLPFFVMAAVGALPSHPDINASVDTDAGTVTRHDRVHLAVAVDTEAGLMAPVIRDAGQLSLLGLAHAIADVATRAREGRMSPDDLTGGTFTITNTGSRGALFDTPIINQPQVAILATGAVVRRPVVVAYDEARAEGIAIRSMAYLALTYDHRLVDGAAAAAFLVDVKTRLEAGLFDADLGLPLA